MKSILNALGAASKRLGQRVLNEPVLLTAVIIAAGNLAGDDLTEVANSVESIVVVVGGIIARHFVTPVRKAEAAKVEAVKSAVDYLVASSQAKSLKRKR